jgi:hypothetical protein
MSIITTTTVMIENSNYHMLVKEGVTAKAMCSRKMWSKSKTSNGVVSHGDGLVKSEFSLRHNYCIVRASDTTWWILALCFTLAIEQDEKYMDTHDYSMLELLCLCGYVHGAGNLVVSVIKSWM